MGKAARLRLQRSATIKAFQYDFNLLADYMQVLQAKMRIAVIYGGDKHADDTVIYRTVNPRPWKSYKAVACDIGIALKDYGFRHVIALADDRHLAQRLKDEGVHLAWLNTGGMQGYSPLSHAAGVLEMLGVPYVGHNPLHGAMLDNKDNFKRILQSIGVMTAPFITWHPVQGALDTKGARFRAVFGDYAGPFVVKPVSGRASLHVMVIDSVDEVTQAAESVHRETLNDVLIETFLPGREFCVAVCGPVIGADGQFITCRQPFAFSAVERVLEDYELIFTSMDVRAITADRIRPIGPDEQALKGRLLRLAQYIYSELNLNSLIRLDVRADAAGVLNVLEANPKPDLKKPVDGAGSLVALGLREYGLAYNDLILSLLADRLHHLFTYNPASVQHITEMLA